MKLACRSIRPGLAAVILLLSLSASLTAEPITIPVELSKAERTQLAILAIQRFVTRPNELHRDALLELAPQDDAEQIKVKSLEYMDGFKTQPGAASGMQRVPVCVESHQALGGTSSITVQVSLHSSEAIGLGATNCSLNVSFANGLTKVQGLPALLDRLSYITKRSPNTSGRPVQFTASTGRSLSTNLLESPSLFRVKDIYPGEVSVFNATESDEHFEHDIFSRPYGVSAIYFIDDDPLFDYRNCNFMVIGDANWDRVVHMYRHSGDDDQFITTAGSHGSGPLGLAYPGGIDFVNQNFVIADVYNKRVNVWSINESNGDLQLVRHITSDFQEPIDVACSWVPAIPGIRNGDIEIAVLDRATGDIDVFGFDGVYRRTLNDFDFGSTHLSRPSSICYGKSLSSSFNTDMIYVLDAGNKRVVGRRSKLSFAVYETPQGSFPENADLVCVESDVYSNIYVLDRANSKIYVFSADLTELIAVYGTKGTATGQMWYPNWLTQVVGWHITYPTVTQQPSRVHDFMLTEQWGAQTGVKRLSLSSELMDHQLEYFPGSDVIRKYDYFDFTWKQSGPATVIATVYRNVADLFYERPIYSCSTLYPGGRYLLRATIEATEGANPPPEWCHVFLRLRDRATGEILADITDSLEYTRSFLPPDREPRIVVTGSGVMSPYTELPLAAACGAPAPQWYKLWVNAYHINGDTVSFLWKSNAAQGGPQVLFTESLGVSPVSQLHTRQDTVFALISNPPAVDNGDTMTIAVVRFYKDSAGQMISFNPCVMFPPEGAASAAIDPEDICWYEHGIVVPYYRHLCDLPDADCPPSPPPSGGCPVLYIWDGAEYDMLNTVLSNSEVPSLTGNQLDFLPISLGFGMRSPTLRLQLREDESETTYLDRFGLVAIDVASAAGRLSVTNLQELVSLTDRSIQPSSAVTSDGRDILSHLLYEDGVSFVQDGPGYVDVSYSIPQEALRFNPTVSLSSAPGGIEPPPPPKESVQKLAVNSDYSAGNYTTVSVRTADGNYTELAKIGARRRRQSPVVEIARYAVNGVVTVRLAWSSRVEIDNLPLQFFERPSVSISTISPTSILHSVQGNVAPALQRSADLPVLLRPGEYIDFEYNVGQVPSGIRRVLVCAIRGRYERVNAGRPVATLPQSFSFEQNYPNPFNPSTTIRFGLPSAQLVRLELYNVLGQKVSTLINSAYEAGYHQFDWDGQLDGQPVASGIYLARLVAGPFQATRKMMVVK